MKVAAYQAPYLPFGSLDAIALIKEQLAICETLGVEMLCCPEAIIGGLAHESAGESPADVAFEVHSAELADVLGPLTGTTVTVIVGFTERDRHDRIFSSAAILANGGISAVYRKVFPGYRTIVQPGTDLHVHQRGSTVFGVMICNDIWYLEPARILSSAGAAIIFVPTNSGHVRDERQAEALRPRGATLPIARAVENTTTIVVADIAGSQDDRQALGCTRIIDPDGVVLAEADESREQLVIADVEAERRSFDPRGWDGATNPAVKDTFLELWQAESS